MTKPENGPDRDQARIVEFGQPEQDAPETGDGASDAGTDTALFANAAFGGHATDEEEAHAAEVIAARRELNDPAEPARGLPESDRPEAAGDEALESEDALDEPQADVISAPLARLLLTPAGMRSALESLLFASPEALSLARLCNALGARDRRTVGAVLAQLRAEYEQAGRGVVLLETAEGWRMATNEAYDELILRLRHRKKRAPLTTAALETLAIVAYRQPIIRAEVEAIRGVECGGTLRNLMDMALVEVVGRKEVLGRPGMYGTTAQFLETFGLRSLDDLPPIAQLKRQMREMEEEARHTEEAEKAAAATAAAEAELARATAAAAAPRPETDPDIELFPDGTDAEPAAGLENDSLDLEPEANLDGETEPGAAEKAAEPDDAYEDEETDGEEDEDEEVYEDDDDDDDDDEDEEDDDEDDEDDEEGAEDESLEADDEDDESEDDDEGRDGRK